MWFTIEHKQHKKTAYEKILQRKQSSQNDVYIEPSYLKEERPIPNPYITIILLENSKWESQPKK